MIDVLMLKIDLKTIFSSLLGNHHPHYLGTIKPTRTDTGIFPSHFAIKIKLVASQKIHSFLFISIFK